MKRRPRVADEQANMAQMASFREALQTARYPVALAGAGLSAASGIPTFRGAGGLWRNHDAMQLATPEAFADDPSMVWQFYHYRRQVCLRAQPNAAHDILASLSTQAVATRVFPAARDGFAFVTQNVDGLSIRAADAIAPEAPRKPIEMHGSIFRVRCSKCKREEPNFDPVLAPALQGTENIEDAYAPVPSADLPHCKHHGCGGLLRPAVVWFGESIPALFRIHELLARCDLLLVLGTSSTVYPAAGFRSQVRSQGGRVAVFDVDEASASPSAADWFFAGGVEKTLPWALGLQGREGEQARSGERI